MKNQKLCYRADGTKATAKKIEEALKQLGAVNLYNRSYYKKGYYYYAVNLHVPALRVVDAEPTVPPDYEVVDFPVTNDTIKVCFKSDGTRKTGKRIIEELKRMGGVNKSNFHGNGIITYYYIDKDGFIQGDSSIPGGYTLKELPERDIITSASVIANKHMADIKVENIKKVMIDAMIEYADLRERKSIKEAEPSFPRIMWVWDGDINKGHEAEVFFLPNQMKYPYVVKYEGLWHSFQYACELSERHQPKEENVLGLVIDEDGDMCICLDRNTSQRIGWIKKDGRCYIMSHEISHKAWEQWAKGGLEQWSKDGFKQSEDVVQFMGQEYLIKYGHLWNKNYGAVYNLKYAQPTAECEDPFVQKLSSGAVKIF